MRACEDESWFYNRHLIFSDSVLSNFAVAVSGSIFLKMHDVIANRNALPYRCYGNPLSA